MNKVIALAAVAGIASTSAAQVGLAFTADVTSANLGDTITWTITAFGVVSPNYVQAYDLDIAASANLGTASTFSNALSALVGPTAGTAVGANINNVSGGQSSLIDPLGLTFGNVVIGTFTVVAGAEGVLSYSATDGGILGANIVRTRNGSDFGPITSDGAPGGITSDLVTIVPTPATAALLGLGGLVATRRRR